MAAQVASRAVDEAAFSPAPDTISACIAALVEHAETWPSAALVASGLAAMRDAVRERCSSAGATAREPSGPHEPPEEALPSAPPGSTVLSGSRMSATAVGL